MYIYAYVEVHRRRASAARDGVDAVGELDEAGKATARLSVRLGKSYERPVPLRQQREVGRLRVEREEAVDRQLRRPDCSRQLVAKLARAPVADVEEVARLAETALAQLVRETPRAPDVRHLHERKAARREHATELVEGRDRGGAR